jgi:hypothetical protein
MPRKARIDASGALHHLIIRGIERRKIFRFGYDRTNFFKTVGGVDSGNKHRLFRMGAPGQSRPFVGDDGSGPDFRAHEPVACRICGVVQQEIPAANRLSKRGERIEKENRFDLIEDKRFKT